MMLYPLKPFVVLSPRQARTPATFLPKLNKMVEIGTDLDGQRVLKR